MALLVAGCALPSPFGGRAVTTKISAQTAKPTASTLAKSKRDALVAALNNLVAAGRASQVTSAVRQASSIISNAGGSIISNAGGGILSDNGLGYRTLADAPRVIETDELVYEITMAPDDSKGEFRTYDKALYKTLPAADRPQALVDHFTIDSVKAGMASAGPPVLAEATYHLTMVSSKRLPFAKNQGLTAKEIYEVTFVGDGTKETLVGWEIAFEMDVSLLDGKTDHASFKAVAGKEDLAFFTDAAGDTLGIPKQLTLTGSNSQGGYQGRMTGADYPVTEMDHETTDTRVLSRLSLQTKSDGTTVRTTELPAEKLRVATTQAADGTGTGQLFDLAGAQPRPIGNLTWTPDGLATITLTEGDKASFKARLF